MRLLRLGGNLAVIGAFLAAASAFWIEPALADVPGASVGDAFGWVVLAVPVFLLAMLCDLVWLVAALRIERGGDRARTVAVATLIAG